MTSPDRLAIHGTDEVIDHSQHHCYQGKDDEERVDIHRVGLIETHLLQIHLGLVQAWIVLEALTKVERSLFVLLQSFVNLSERKVLQPGLAFGRLHVEGAFGQEDSVVVELEVEEDSSKVEEEIRVV